jgi:hypothetical protein
MTTKLFTEELKDKDQSESENDDNSNKEIKKLIYDKKKKLKVQFGLMAIYIILLIASLFIL